MFVKFLTTVTRIAEFIAATILGAIFITFLLQIFARYAPKIAWLAPVDSLQSWMQSLVPIGWTINLISLLWVWLIFFGCSFIVRDRDHVIFDVFFNAVTPRVRRLFALATAVLLIVVMIYAFGPTYDAIFESRLMQLKKIQTLSLPITGERIPIKWLFAPILLFMVATILRYGETVYRLIRGKGGGMNSHTSTGTTSKDNGGLS